MGDFILKLIGLLAAVVIAIVLVQKAKDSSEDGNE